MSWIITQFRAALDRVDHSGGSPPAADAILKEDGFYLLLETGDKILLE